MNKKSAPTPVIYVYFALACLTSSKNAAVLEREKYQISQENKKQIIYRFFKSKGSSFSPPFVKSELGFKLYEYDLEPFEHWTNMLFIELSTNAPMVSKWKNSGSVFSSFVININSMNTDHRPVFSLRPEQTELLANFGASIDFDCYLMFGNEEN
jgi:hypothetical protein